jgi:predicted membrane protein
MHDVPHGALVLLMWGVAAGFVHGVGFTPRGSMLRFWLGPLAAWVLMAFGLAFLLVAR